MRHRHAIFITLTFTCLAFQISSSALYGNPPIMPSMPRHTCTQQSDDILAAIAQAQKQNASTRQSFTFRQTKHSPMLAADAVSNGRMIVGPGKKLVWQYTTPKAFSLIVDGDSTYTETDGVRVPLAGNNGRITRRMSSMMMGLAEGKSLLDNKQFSSTLNETPSDYIVTLTPQRRDMRRIMQHITLTFDKKTLDISSVNIEEGKDSFTLIVFEKEKNDK